MDNYSYRDSRRGEVRSRRHEYDDRDRDRHYRSHRSDRGDRHDRSDKHRSRSRRSRSREHKRRHRSRSSRRRSDSREDRHKSKRHKEHRSRKDSRDNENSMERYYNRVKMRVQQGIPTKFSTFQDPQYEVKYQTPQEKLDEYKRENPNIDTTVHNKTDRQLYIGNLPPEITIPELCKHLNDAMYALNLCNKEDRPIVDSWISSDGHYAFVEFRTIKDAHLGFNLTQISIHGHALKVGKPRIANSSYAMMQQQMAQTNKYEDVVKINQQPSGGFVNPSAMAATTVAMNNQFDNLIKPNASNPSSLKDKVVTVTRLLVSNLPLHYDTSQAKVLLEVVGPVKSIELRTDQNTGKYNGEAYVEYEREEDSRKAETTLMGMSIGDAFLHVKKIQTTTVLQKDKYPAYDPNMGRGEETGPTPCLVLTNLIMPETVKDMDEYIDVEDETFEEMENYGKVLTVVAPRPSANYRPGMPLEPGVGKVYVKFANNPDAQVGKEAMKGRRFEGRIVDAQFYSEDRFNNNQFD